MGRASRRRLHEEAVAPVAPRRPCKHSELTDLLPPEWREDDLPITMSVVVVHRPALEHEEDRLKGGKDEAMDEEQEAPQELMHGTLLLIVLRNTRPRSSGSERLPRSRT